MTAIAKKETAAIATAQDIPTTGVPHVGSQDILVPKILVIQKMSKKAADKTSEAEVGDLRDTVNDAKFGDESTPMPFIPVSMVSFWSEYDMAGGGQGKFIRNVPISAANEALPNVEGNLKRVRTYESFVLLPEEVKAGVAFPYVLSFRVTSVRAGKNLLTQMYVKNRDAGKPPWHAAMQLNLTEESNDHGDFYVQHVKLARAATVQEAAEASRWFNIINAGGVKKDDRDITEGAGETSASVNSDKF